MTVECPQCGTKLPHDEEPGAPVRCTNCQHDLVVPPGASADLSPLDAASFPPPPTMASDPFALDGDSEDIFPPSVSEDSAGSIHECQTAVFMIPAEIRAAAQGEGIDSPLLQPAAGLSALPQEETATAASSLRPRSPSGRQSESPRPRQPSGGVTIDLASASESGPDEIADADLISMDDDESTMVGTVQIPDAARIAAQVANESLADVPQFTGGLAADGTLFPTENKAPAPLEAEASVPPEIVEEEKSEPQPEAVAVQPPVASSGVSLWVNLATTFLALALLALGVLLYLGGGHLDFSVLGNKSGSARSTGAEAEDFEGVSAVAMRSVRYPTSAGRELLVFTGEAENRAAQPRGPVDVVAELRDPNGQVVASERAPLGLALGPQELASLVDQESLRTAFRKLAVEKGEAPLQPGARAPFTVVLLDPPSGLARLSHSVRLIGGSVVAPPPPSPPPPQTVEPRPPLEEPKSKVKGKGKGKQTKVRRKVK